MTALMYKKPDDHIKFLEECLSKAEKEKKIQWHTFIEPLPPIPKSSDKIRSENEDEKQLQGTKSVSPVLKQTDPLPPITHHESGHSKLENNLPNISATGIEEDTQMITEQDLSDDSSAPKMDSTISIDDDAGLEERDLSGEDNSELQQKLSISALNQHNFAESIIQVESPILFILGMYFSLIFLEIIFHQQALQNNL